MTTTVTAKIVLRKGTAAEWTSANPTLAVGEIGFETDTKKEKMGDGATAWTALSYYYDPASDAASLAAHEAAANPHPGYLTPAEGNAAYEPVNSNIQSHIASTSNPHSTTASQVGADATGTASGLMVTHEAALNPHPVYLTTAEGNAAYEAIGAVAGHAAGSGVHAIASTTGLQTALDGKSATSHTHSGTYEPAGTVSTHAAGSNVHAIASVTGLQTALDSKSATSHNHDSAYALIANGVTNGDSHNHNGGDGAQIAYSTLSGLPTLGTAAATAASDYATATHNHTGVYETLGAIATHAALTTTHGISSFGASLVDDADASAARTTLGLGTAATTASGDYATAAHTHAASAIASGTIDTARLGSGTANSSTYLRGDQTWASASGGVAADTHAATEKTTPVDADELPLVNSASGWALGKITLGNIKTWLQSLFAVLAGKSGGQTIIGGTGVTDKLVLQGTSGNGTSTTTAIEFKVGNNGAVVSNIENCGRWNITGSSESAVNALIRFSNSYSGEYIPLMELLSPNIPTGKDTYIGFGKSATINNRASLGFFYAGSGSNDNYCVIGSFYGVSNGGVRCYADGRIKLLNNGVTPKLEITSTTEQLRLGYDATNYTSFTVSSAGNLTITPVGGTLTVGTLNATSILTQSQLLSVIQFGAL